MTHSHDTSTPAMSAETVPSEEFVLVPKGQWADAYKAFVGAFDTTIDRRKRPDEYALDARIRLREFNEAVQGTLSASHLAKVGGEAVLDRDAFEAAHAAHIGVSPKLVRSWRTDDGGCGEGYKAQPSHSAWYGWKLCRAALTSLPQPSPDLAKGGDAVREASEDTARLDYLDRCNQALNAHYGTTYRWELVQSHNVNRLMLGHMVVDLNDSAANGLPSCRDAIDRARRRTALSTEENR